MALGLLILSLSLVTSSASGELVDATVHTINSGGVDTRLNLVNVTYSGTETGTLTIDVETRITGGISQTIAVFQNAFQLDGALTEHIIAVEFSGQQFISPTYTTTEDFMPALDETFGRLRYIYTFDGGERVVLSGSDWSPVLQVTLTFTQVRATGTITWFPDTYPPIYFVADEMHNQITGIEEPIPAELQNISLAPPAVDLRMSFVDLQYYDNVTGTITYDVEAQSWDGLPHIINSLQSSFVLTDALSQEFSGAEFSQELLSSPSYDSLYRMIDVPDDPPWTLGWYIYTFSSGERYTLMDANWHKVVRVSVTFTQSPEIGHIVWHNPDLAPFDNVGEWLPEEGKIRNIAGERLPIPAELASFPLYVPREHIYLPLVIKQP
jgi:hypothetical protein